MGGQPPEHSDVDQLTLRELDRLFTHAKPTLDRVFNAAEHFAIDPASSLAADDDALDVFTLSGAALSTLLNAADHLDALRSMLFEAKVLYSRAPYTLLRCALESASVAVWLLAPADRNERILRRLRWEWADTGDKYTAFELMTLTPAQSKVDRGQRLADLAHAQGMTRRQIRSISEHPGFGQIVRRAAAEGELLDKTGNEALWRLCSGIAHGRSWATLPLMEHRRAAPIDDKRTWVRLTASERNLLSIAHVTVLTLEQARILLDRCRRECEEVEDSTPEADPLSTL